MNKRGWMLTLLMAMGPVAHAQQKVGEVQHLQGMATAQQAGGSLRFMVKGDPVLAGDTLTTTDKGFAVVGLSDGSKITLRPATTFAIEKYSQVVGEESAVLRLFKGGLRAVSGLINRTKPGSMEFRTLTATVGIRGTSFDARLCAEDCRAEERTAEGRPPVATVPAADMVVARVVRLTGEATALQTGQAGQGGQTARRLVEGAPLYAGDEVKTNAGGVAVIGFRDQSRLALNPETAFRITGFSYKRPKQPDNIAIYLLKGGLRVFTGLIGKQDPKAMALQTRLSTIGVRGTGMDISCEGPCADSAAGDQAAPPVPGQGDGLFMVTWLGQTYFVVPAAELDVNLGTAGFVGGDRAARLLPAVPDFMSAFAAPRPDQMEIDWQRLFGAVGFSGGDGLYVFVRDGYVSLLSALGQTDLGIGETGYLGANGPPQRLEGVPRFLSDDPFPIPELFSASETRILQLFGATLGQPGQDICRL
jgi:hypothetical protein